MPRNDMLVMRINKNRLSWLSTYRLIVVRVVNSTTSSSLSNFPSLFLLFSRLNFSQKYTRYPHYIRNVNKWVCAYIAWIHWQLLYNFWILPRILGYPPIFFFSRISWNRVCVREECPNKCSYGKSQVSCSPFNIQQCQQFNNINLPN